MKQIANITLVWFLVLSAPAGQSEAQNSNDTVGTKAIGIEEAVRDLPASIKTPNRYALVIGTGEYTDDRIPALPAGSNDARRLYEILIDPAIGMFAQENVTLLLDEAVTRPKVVSALDSLGRKAGKDDLVIVFFSGHGAVDDRGRPYWVMQNTKIDDLRASALSETEITELLDEIRTTRLVTLIDACYSASTAEIGRSKSLVDIQKIYPKFKGEGRVAITGSKGDQLSVVISDKNHPGYGHSAFTWHVISGMKGSGDTDKDGVVTVDELWDYVKDRTELTARQQGGNQQPQLKGQIGSKFLLTVDGERLVANSQQFKQLIGSLKQLFLADKLTPEQYRTAEGLLRSKAESLDQMQLERRQVYTDLASGKLDSRYLQAALDATETPEQRRVRLERQAREEAQRERERQVRLEQEARNLAERERRGKFSSLVTQAKSKDNRQDGKEALGLLEDALRLYPGDIEALALQKKIRGYFGPNSGDVVTNSIGMKLVWIPPGEFMMGSGRSASSLAREYDTKEGNFGDEYPQHKVGISRGLWMGQTEVTQGQWEAIMGTTVLQQRDKAITSRPLRGEEVDYPIYYVSWEEAIEFCQKLSRQEGKTYRLPTEAEWEYACRGDTKTAYSFGNSVSSLGDYGWFYDNAYDAEQKYAHQVGKKRPNAFGLYDMHGNVWEWCNDWYGENYYSSSPGVDPQGPSSGSYRVLRGGSWLIDSGYCRSACRFRLSPVCRSSRNGFRVVSLDF